MILIKDLMDPFDYPTEPITNSKYAFWLFKICVLANAVHIEECTAN